MNLFGPHVPSIGPHAASIFILAEAPGDKESEALRPLVGPSGYELRRMLRTIGVNLDDTYRANVFSRQPEGNNLTLYGTEDKVSQFRDLGPLSHNPLAFLDVAHRHELDRVHQELAAVNPNVVIALGNTATWALGLGLGINTLRGSVHTCTIPTLSRPLKVVPTFHPAMVLRQWDQRVVSLADLEKAHVESTSPDFSFDNSELWIAPSLDDLDEFDREHMVGATICACDIETKRGQITCISFAPRNDISLVIPFWMEGDSPSYWSTPREEALAWGYVKRWMERADLTKVFQNGLYDLQYIQHAPPGIRPRACTEDTMLMHHSLFSELKKGLGFLGSVYANVPSWKSMRTFKREEILKRDD
jgi:uracil-DNA glycosylase